MRFGCIAWQKKRSSQRAKVRDLKRANQNQLTNNLSFLKFNLVHSTWWSSQSCRYRKPHNRWWRRTVSHHAACRCTWIVTNVQQSVCNCNLVAPGRRLFTTPTPSSQYVLTSIRGFHPTKPQSLLATGSIY
jgi:hypothetical protein